MSDAQKPIENDDEISLGELWAKAKLTFEFLWRKKVWIVLVGLLFGLRGYYKVQLSKPIYSASISFSLEQGNADGGLSGLASQFGFSLGSGGEGLGGDNLLSLMKSRRILEAVLFSKIASNTDSIRLIEQYLSTLPELRKQWDSVGILPFNSLNQLNSNQDSAIGLIVNKLSEKSLEVSKVDKKLSFVTVSFSSHDPVFTKHFVELVGEKATGFYVETKMASSRVNIKKLERRVDSVSAELNAAMSSYSQSQDQDQFIVQSVAKVPSMQKQIKLTMLTTLYGELVKNLEISKTMAAREEPLITIIDRPHYPLRVRESKLKSTVMSSVLGCFLCIAFFGARAFIQDLNQQAKQFEEK